MASIVHRGKSYSVVYSIWNGGTRKQKWETYHSYEAAVRRKEQLELVRSVEQQKKQLREDCLAKLMEDYIELYGTLHWSYSTYSSNIALIRNYIVPLMGTMRLSEFTPRTIAALYRQMLSGQHFNLANQDGPLTPKILLNIHKLLHSAFEQAVLWEYIDRNPFHKIDFPKAYPTEVKILSVEEIRQFFRGCQNDILKLALHLAFAGSLRKGEILALTWDDINLTAGTVTVSKTLKRVSQEAVTALGESDILHCFPPVFGPGKTVMIIKKPKTRSSMRTVFLPRYVINALAAWRSRQVPIEYGQPDLVFRYTDGRPLQEDALSRLLEKELLRLGLPVVTFHSIRHSSISYKLVLTGGDIKAVQGDSGHAQAEMITERYGHVIDVGRKGCAQSFQEEFYNGL